MALYRRGRTWYADFYAQGQRVQESTGTTNRREAEKFVALRLSEVARGEFSKATRILLADFGERYLAYARTHKRSWRRDEQMLGHLHKHFGAVELGTISPLEIEGYQQARIREVCPATVNRELALLKHMFNMAERWGFHRGSNPVRLVKFLREDNLQFQTISEEEERALLAYCPPYLQDMVKFAINTGLRSGEIFHLQWEDVNIEEKRIRVMVRKTRRYLELPLNDAALQILEAWRGMRRGPYVFYNQETCDRFKDVKLGLKKAVKRAGLKGITWHTFRHTFASRVAQHGADIVTVKELLGHSTVVVTIRYAHSNDESKRRAVAKLSASDSHKIVTLVKNRVR